MMFHKDTRWDNQFKEDINNNRCMLNLINLNINLNTNLKIHRCMINNMAISQQVLLINNNSI